jgi:hypothetical protein
LRTLVDHDVDFIVVEALSAVLQGAPVMKVDVDIVHDTSAENVASLLAALDQMDARFRGHGEKVLRPTIERLSGTGHHLLITDYGPLDVLGAIEHGLSYSDLLDDTLEVALEETSIRVLALSKYVELKEESDLNKDRARLPVLHQTLRVQQEDEE